LFAKQFNFLSSSSNERTIGRRQVADMTGVAEAAANFFPLLRVRKSFLAAFSSFRRAGESARARNRRGALARTRMRTD
jgi:hypothetical protein